MNSTGNWKSLVYVFNCMRSAKCGHFCQFKRIVQFNDCSMSFLRGVSLFFRANEPDFTVAISHMQWHATQVYSVERKKGYTLLHARRKKHHYQKTYWFWNVYTHPKLIRMQSMFKWKKTNRSANAKYSTFTSSNWRDVFCFYVSSAFNHNTLCSHILTIHSICRLSITFVSLNGDWVRFLALKTVVYTHKTQIY